MGMTGAEIVYAAKRGVAWNTAEACGVGDGFLGLPITADPDTGLVVDDSLGQFFATDASPGETKLEPSLPAYLRYNDKVLLGMVAAFMGTAGVPAAHAGGAASYDHTLKMAKNVDGLFFTLAAKLGTGFVEEIPSWKIAKAVFTWETGKPTQLALSGPGIDLIVDSAVNTMASFAAVTTLETANRCYMGQTEFRMNDQSDVALSAADKTGPSKIVLTLERKLTGFYGSYVSASTDGGAPRDLIDEPTNDGMPTGTLSVTYPRLKDSSGRIDIRNNTSKKAEIICTGPVIEGVTPFSIKFQLTHLKPKKNTNTHKQGQLDNVREYDVLGATEAPAGMVGNTDPCWILLTNKISTDLLA
jgi:hypothetical protein